MAKIVVDFTKESKATPAQIEYIKDLCKKAGYDVDDYNLPELTFSMARDLIDELKKDV